jgi:hypothetical protein
MRRQVWLVVLAIVVVAGVTAFASFGQDSRGAPPSIEGAWFGTVSIVGVGDTPSMDTFVSNAITPQLAGTFLCTIPAAFYPNPMDPAGWLTVTPSGHGNWRWTGRNEYSFTAMRVVMNQNGVVVGTARYWGVITPVSADEYSGSMNARFYHLDGTPLYPSPPFPDTFTGTLSSRRIAITGQ